MGIFSKFQIKDIKTKILGGRVKHKADVPSISVIPPTPSVKNDFSFRDSKTTGLIETRAEEKLRPRSRSLPDFLNQDCLPDFHPTQINQNSNSAREKFTADIANTNIKFYLELPRNRRGRKKNRKKTQSCPEKMFDLPYDGSLDDSVIKTVDFGSSFPPAVENRFSTGDLITRSTSEQDVRGSQEFGMNATENQHENVICGYSINDCSSEAQSGGLVLDSRNMTKDICGRSASTSFIPNNGGNDFMKDIPTEEALSDAEETTPLFEENASTCREFEESSKAKATLGERIRRRVLSSYRTTPETRWSLDLERLLHAGDSKEELSQTDQNKWDGQFDSEKMQPSSGKSIVSTWSLDLDNKNKTKMNCDVERTMSEICVSGSPSLSNKKPECANVMTNAKSLDLDLASKNEAAESKRTTSETMLETTSLKRGFNDYLGRFNGIVSKFSTWSLDVELNRKRYEDEELSDSHRAHSEILLDVSEKAAPERFLSYHSLLYDIDEASRYQIYQPTVYEIGDEDGTVDVVSGKMLPAKAGQYSNSMKFISKQFGHLYENSCKNLYKNGYAIIDAIKQREKELKAIADRQHAGKSTELIFKPKTTKPKARPRSNSYHKSGHTKQSKVG